MSKFIDEIIEDIKTHPHTWRRNGEWGLKKDNVEIRGFGNGHKLFFLWATSVVDVSINDVDTWSSLTWFDKYRLEETFKWWTKNASLDLMSK